MATLRPMPVRLPRSARRVAGAWRRRRLERWREAPFVSEADPIVIGGCGRSGTTLLRVMLDSHPRIACGPESALLHEPFQPHRAGWLAGRFGLDEGLVRELLRGSGSQAEFVDRFFEAYRRSTGKPRWGDKTPRNVNAIAWVFAHFPRARFVHVIRDGRDTAVSLRTHPRHRVVDGALVPVQTWNPIDECVGRWRDAIEKGRPFRGHPGYAEVRYEGLVAEPEATLHELLEWLGEPWDDAVLHHSDVSSPSRDPAKFPQNPEATRPVYDSAVGRWRSELSAEDAAAVKALAGDLLVELGYAEDRSWEPEPQGVR
jgi:hypothetical protein